MSEGPHWHHEPPKSLTTLASGEVDKEGRGWEERPSAGSRKREEAKRRPAAS